MVIGGHPLQGEIWWAEAEDKRRPVLVVTRDAVRSAERSLRSPTADQATAAAVRTTMRV